jgi:dienelactone hydrolase
LRSGDLRLEGRLVLPGETVGVVAFVHPGALNELGVRGAFVVDRLEAAGIASLSVGIEGPADHTDPGTDAAAAAAKAAVDRLHEELPTVGIPVGVLGVGACAGAALLAAAGRPESVRAVLCLGGEPDRVPAEALSSIEAPVLLVVGDEDPAAFERLRALLALLPAPESALEILAGAGDAATDRRSFELDCDLATAWFRRHLGSGLPAATETAGG